MMPPCYVIIYTLIDPSRRWLIVSMFEQHKQQRGEAGRQWTLFCTTLVAMAYSWAAIIKPSVSFVVKQLK